MNAVRQEMPMSFADYLQFEKSAENRHEFLNGIIYAMTGSSRRHGLIVGNIVAALRRAAQKKKCEIQSADIKVEVKRNDLHATYYPDVVITCDQHDDDDYLVRKPCVLVEVLSPSTQNIDMREKRSHYTMIDSLELYLIVAQEEKLVRAYRRANAWSEQITDAGGSVSIPCVAAELALTAIYEGILA
jgi:Uma2 family endonuclease